jgi:putative NADPH-quinone reductase
MTTFTTNDREEAYKKILEEAPAHIGYEDAVDPVACSVTINVEPIPFMGMVTLQDTEDREQMLREQIRIQQNEIGRLKAKLMSNGISE